MNTAPVILLPVTSITSADVVSAPQTVQFYSGYSVQAIWTGASLAGTVKLQASLNYNPGGGAVGSTGGPPNSGTWDTIPNTTQTISGPGSFMWNAWPVMYSWFRVYFTYTSGSGTVSAIGRIKG